MCVCKNTETNASCWASCPQNKFTGLIPEITGEQDPDTFMRWQMKINYTEAIISHLECIKYHECYSH